MKRALGLRDNQLLQSFNGLIGTRNGKSMVKGEDGYWRAQGDIQWFDIGEENAAKKGRRAKRSTLLPPSGVQAMKKVARDQAEEKSSR